ncbi:MAG: dihydroneopterin aldolase family protein [Halolamina sp.]
MSDAPTDAQQACFEAGIKFGSLYHQFAGTPVSPESTRSLETAIAESIENQPYCESVTVDILDDRVAADIGHDEVPGSNSDREHGSRSSASEQDERAETSSGGYTELSGHLMEVKMRIEYEDVVVRTRMEMTDGYPLMKLVAVDE